MGSVPSMEGTEATESPAVAPARPADGVPARPGWPRRASAAITGPATGPAIIVWLATRLAVFVAGWYASWALAGPPLLLQGPDIQVGSPVPFPELWNHWDALHYQSIAGPGYGSANFETNYAFFPASRWPCGWSP